ncbi:aldo/keto reductase [Allobranchiibius sp. CTAmp26]|uniref:aldo/keto reductase n=1 Tax=Allobranchiibius sp. CTAmp26 TaxID=2815214 RepID=UPI001AA16351|nr:aldo/keto reductase [Allobranchiibius sp. CTAmp26]MBO1753910.1 aldo/keto reductase [Allobranchiibius sp. CTAmp26]
MTSTTHESRFDPSLQIGDLIVPRVGYGAMQLAGAGVIGLPQDPNNAIALLQHAVEQGVRFFDTANAYGPRTVNQLIGRALAPFGDDIIIGNKVGATRGPRGEWVTDSRPDTIRSQVEDALFDLRTERSSLTYLRLWGDSEGRAGSIAEDVPLEDSLGALVDMQREGKIDRIGISGANSELLARAQQVTKIAAVQNRYNLIDRSGVEVLAACERDSIAFVPYFPLATGGIAGLDALTAPARRLRVSEPTIALAWLLRRSAVIVPIPGTQRITHLDDNLHAAEIATDLTNAEVQALTDTEDESTAALTRMPTRMLDALRRPRST